VSSGWAKETGIKAQRKKKEGGKRNPVRQEKGIPLRPERREGRCVLHAERKGNQTEERMRAELRRPSLLFKKSEREASAAERKVSFRKKKEVPIPSRGERPMGKR